MKCVLLLVCFVLYFEIYNACECPAATAIKVIEKNSDPNEKKMLNVVTTCKNDKDEVIDTCNERMENPFGPDVQVHSFQYKGVINKHIAVNRSFGPKEHNDVETFD